MSIKQSSNAEMLSEAKNRLNLNTLLFGGAAGASLIVRNMLTTEIERGTLHIQKLSVQQDDLRHQTYPLKRTLEDAMPTSTLRNDKSAAVARFETEISTHLREKKLNITLQKRDILRLQDQLMATAKKHHGENWNTTNILWQKADGSYDQKSMFRLVQDLESLTDDIADGSFDKLHQARNKAENIFSITNHKPNGTFEKEIVLHFTNAKKTIFERLNKAEHWFVKDETLAPLYSTVEGLKTLRKASYNLTKSKAFLTGQIARFKNIKAVATVALGFAIIGSVYSAIRGSST